MRGMFGLVSLLVCAAIVAYVWSMHTAAISKSGNQALDQARQISGYDENGKSALESITLAGSNNAGGHLKGMLVTDIVAGGAMEKFYGLKKGDQIIVEGQYPVDTSDDAGLASGMLLRAYQASQPLTVIREGKQITLPTQPAPGSATPGQSLQDQLNQIRKQQ